MQDKGIVTDLRKLAKYLAGHDDGICRLEAACIVEAADEIEKLRAALIYAAETTTDKHTSRKLFAVLNRSTDE